MKKKKKRKLPRYKRKLKQNPWVNVLSMQGHWREWGQNKGNNIYTNINGFWCVKLLFGNWKFCPIWLQHVLMKVVTTVAISSSLNSQPLLLKLLNFVSIWYPLTSGCWHLQKVALFVLSPLEFPSFISTIASRWGFGK